MTSNPGNDLDVRVILRGLRRHLLMILAGAVLLGLVTYLLTNAQPRIYSASSTLLATGTGGTQSEAMLGNASVKAPPLPDGAFAQALKSPKVVQPLIEAVEASDSFDAQEKERIIRGLQADLAAQRLGTVSMTSRLDPYTASGIYTITARARTPLAAATLANLVSEQVLRWDLSRALDSIKRAEAGFQAQLVQIDDQLRTQSGSVERQTLISRRASVQSSLVQLGLLETSASGILSPLSDAVPPDGPIAPRPVRNTALALLMALTIGAALSIARTVFDRTIRSEEDIFSVEMPVLTTVPKMRHRDTVMLGLVKAAREAGLYEAIGFLRVNLHSQLQGVSKPVIMITSTTPGEGKSSITAALADGMGSSGQRVLVVDADLRRGTQSAIWQRFNAEGEWHTMSSQLTGTAVRTSPEGFRTPENIEVLRVTPNVDLLPAGPAIHDSLGVFNQSNLRRALDIWKEHYDVILVDSAPLLALADGLVLGRYADAVVMIVEYGKTQFQAMRSALRRAERGGLRVVGAVINKADIRDERSYGYGYGYGATETQKSEA